MTKAISGNEVDNLVQQATRTDDTDTDSPYRGRSLFDDSSTEAEITRPIERPSVDPQAKKWYVSLQMPQPTLLMWLLQLLLL